MVYRLCCCEPEKRIEAKRKLNSKRFYLKFDFQYDANTKQYTWKSMIEENCQ